MYRSMFRSKIHRATVTGADLHYEGSVTIDADLLEASDILPNQEVEIWNVTNGERFSTYALRGQPGSGVVCINGAAAHKASPGDLVIIATFSWMSDEQAKSWEPTVSCRRKIARQHCDSRSRTQQRLLVIRDLSASPRPQRFDD